MQRARSTRTASVTTKVNYRENPDSSDDEPGILTNILGLLMDIRRRSAQKKKKKTPRQSSKRKKSTGGCDCPNCSVRATKRRCSRHKSRPRGRAKERSSTSTSTAASAPYILESDDEEVVDTKITETHENTIKNKVDHFFKALDSDEDELESKLNIKPSAPELPEQKSRDFYCLLSDSEDEKDKPSTSATKTSFVPEPSTSGLANHINTGIKIFSQTLNKIQEKKAEDLFAYVDEILNDCNIVDITDDKPKENDPVMSLEDLKKKTDEILGGVQSLVDDIKPKPKEPEKTPETEAPACPICLETLGGSRQTMATFCGHMFCEPCILQVAKTSKKCPTCRKGVTKSKYHPVYI